MSPFPPWLAAVAAPLAWVLALAAFARGARRAGHPLRWWVAGTLLAAVAVDTARTVVLDNDESLHAWPRPLLLLVLAFIALALAYRAHARFHA